MSYAAHQVRKLVEKKSKAIAKGGNPCQYFVGCSNKAEFEVKVLEFKVPTCRRCAEKMQGLGLPKEDVKKLKQTA